jgi:glucans biosynthesis protein C
LWPVLGLALMRLTLFSSFGSTHALVDDWYNHASYGLLFLLGVGLAQQPQHFVRLQVLRWPALALALACWAGIEVYLGQAPEGLRALQRVAYAVLQWSAIVAALGFAHRHLNTDHPWRARLSEAVFPVYLVHQTVIILLAMAFAPLALPAGAEAALLVLLTFALSLAFWRLARASGPLRPWLGLPRGAPRVSAAPVQNMPRSCG